MVENVSGKHTTRGQCLVSSNTSVDSDISQLLTRGLRPIGAEMA